jgi:hypothetical protein
MNIDEERFAVALRELAEQEPLTAAPTVQVLGRAHRARRMRAAVAATASLTVVAVAAVTVVSLGGTGGGAGGSPGATAAASAPVESTPALRLVAAVEASAQTSFRFTATTTSKIREFGRHRTTAPRTVTGAYDPNGPKGYARYGKVEQVVVGKQGYLVPQDDAGWSKPFRTNGQGLGIGPDDIGLLDPLATVDFVKQFATLKKAGQVKLTGTSGSGASAVERYSFRFTWEPGDPDQPKAIPVAGTIDVGVRSKLVATMTYDYTLTYPEGPADARFDYTVRWDYSDYGVKVDVKLPK